MSGKWPLLSIQNLGHIPWAPLKSEEWCVLADPICALNQGVFCVFSEGDSACSGSDPQSAELTPVPFLLLTLVLLPTSPRQTPVLPPTPQHIASQPPTWSINTLCPALFSCTDVRSVLKGKTRSGVTRSLGLSTDQMFNRYQLDGCGEGRTDGQVDA